MYDAQGNVITPRTLVRYAHEYLLREDDLPFPYMPLIPRVGEYVTFETDGRLYQVRLVTWQFEPKSARTIITIDVL